MFARRAVIAIATSASLIAMIGCAATACSQAYAAADPPAGDPDAGVDGSGPTDASANGEGQPATDDASDAAAPFDIKVLATGYTLISGIAADDTNVYFAEQGSGGVHRVALAGGPVFDLVMGGGSPSSLAITNGFLYWTDTGKGTVSRIATTGGPVTMAIPRDAPPRTLAATDDHVFVLYSGTAAAPKAGEVVTYGIDLMADLAGPVSLVEGFSIAATGTSFYWTETSPTDVVAMGTVGSTTRTVVSTAPDSQSVAADKDGVFWTNTAAGTILVMTAGNLSTIATGQQRPRSLASDGMFVYWLTENGFLRRNDVRGIDMPKRMASGFAAPLATNFRAVALTSTYVVWFTEDGRVLQVAK